MQLDLGLNLGIYNEFRKALDFLSVQSSAAYSLRKLRNAYTGSAIRVRRSLDNAEADIGFSGTDLDTAALQSFVGSQNLLQHSEAFENAVWESLSGSAETVNANNSVAPDGTTTADTCTITTATSGRFQYFTLASAGQITFSVYVKSGGNGTWVRVGLFDQVLTSNQARCWVNMSTGTLGTVNSIGTGWSGVSATSTSVGNDWYRVSITATCTVTAISTLIINANADGDVNRTIGQNRILWGAQLNTGTLQPYSPTTRRNLLTFTEAFNDAAWTKTRTGVTANTITAPDSTITADTMTTTATGSSASGVYATVSGSIAGSFTFSCYVKKGDLRYIALGIWNTSTIAECTAGFDLDTGTVTGQGAIGAGYSTSNATITSVGNGWFRCSAVFTSPASTNYPAILHRDAPYTSGTLTGNIPATGTFTYLWGAQLELGSTSTEYQRVDAAWTSTRDGNGFVTTLYDQGRFWYATRRNLLQYSEAFDDAVWAKLRSTITSNAGVAPDGTTTADAFIPEASTSSKAISQDVNLTSGITYTHSVYVKANGYNFVQLTESTGFGSTEYVNFNLSNGTIGNTNMPSDRYSITSVGNGWYRISITDTATATGAGRFLLFVISTDVASRAPSFTSNGVLGVLIWGAQLELGSTATEYQPMLTGTPLNATQATAANQPSIVTAGVVNTVNGKPALLFNGTSNFLSHSYSHSGESSLFCVVNRVGAGATGQGVYFATAPSTRLDNSIWAKIDASPPSNNWGSFATPFWVDSGVTLGASPTVLTTISNTPPTGSVQLYTNGTFSAQGTGRYAGDANDRRRIGHEHSGNTRFLSGHIAEIVFIPSALSTADRQTLERNQGVFYGITVS